MGELLRRYWHPVATTADLERGPVRGVKILGEELVLFRTTRGAVGLVQRRCPHRGVSLAYGMPDEDGLRCSNHGWCFDRTGACVSQPFEDTVNPNGRFKDKIRVVAYPVEELGDLIWAYLGPPERRPLLPRWEVLVREGVDRSIAVTELPCNWAQIMENSVDPVHFEWLHAHYLNYLRKKRGVKPVMKTPRHLRIGFEVFEHGIYKKRLMEGDDPETSPDWRIGHPILFPNMLAFKGKSGGHMQIRVPIDDTHTWHIFYTCHRPADPTRPETLVYELPWQNPDGTLNLDTLAGTDMMAWVTQGPIAPRHEEHLGASDEGVILWRKVMADALDAVERGEDPPGLVRDPARNFPVLEFRGEEDLGEARVAFKIPGRRVVGIRERFGDQSASRPS